MPCRHGVRPCRSCGAWGKNLPEIEQERNALKMIRGDLNYMPESVDPRRQAEELISIQER